jgi:phage terminase small subunit
MALDLAISKEFTPMQREFIEQVSRGVDPETAALAAGYTSESSKRVTYDMLRQPQILAAVQIAVARKLAIAAPIALKVLHDFAGDKTVDPRLRVVCARDILNRAGHIAPKAVAQVSNAAKPLNEMSMTELRELADKLEDELSGRAKDVSSATTAPVKPQALEDIM